IATPADAAHRDAGVRFVGNSAFVRRDPFLQLHDLKAAFLRFSLFARLGRLRLIAWFHGEPPFWTSDGLRKHRSSRVRAGRPIARLKSFFQHKGKEAPRQGWGSADDWFAAPSLMGGAASIT